MATGQKISAQTVATTWSGSDMATIVQSGVNKSITHDVFMDDTQICKAWVNFNGTGTVAIRDDYNVSSITDNGTGDYTVNFTNAMSDANYSMTGSVKEESNAARGSSGVGIKTGTTPLTTSINISVRKGAGASTSGDQWDSDYVMMQIFGS